MSEPTKPAPGLKWCHPRDYPDRRTWLLQFEDADRGRCIYYDESEARTAFDTAEARGWNCHLFASAPRYAAAAGPPRETAWLVELRVHDMFDGWLRGGYLPPQDMGWTKDPNKALRFSRKEDADAYRERHGYTFSARMATHLSTEHTWMDAAPPAASAAPATVSDLHGMSESEMDAMATCSIPAKAPAGEPVPRIGPEPDVLSVMREPMVGPNGHHGVCNYAGAGPAEVCRQCHALLRGDLRYACDEIKRLQAFAEQPAKTGSGK